MAKIIKVGSQNPTFTHLTRPEQKTSRNSTTNPFQFTNFEGNTLPVEFADVFASSKTQTGNNKLKMIASSVTGSMNKMKSLIPESIINFVNRVRGGISNAWDYAKNTNISDLGAVKAFNDVMNAEIKLPGLKGLSESMSNIGKGISSHLEFLNTDVTDIGKGISEKMEFLNSDVTDIGKGMGERWTNLISKIHQNKISADMPVAELEQLWKDDIALQTKEAA